MQEIGGLTVGLQMTPGGSRALFGSPSSSGELLRSSSRGLYYDTSDSSRRLNGTAGSSRALLLTPLRDIPLQTGTLHMMLWPWSPLLYHSRSSQSTGKSPPLPASVLSWTGHFLSLKISLQTISPETLAVPYILFSAQACSSESIWIHLNPFSQSHHSLQPSLLKPAHLKSDLARPTLLQQPPIKYE